MNSRVVDYMWLLNIFVFVGGQRFFTLPFRSLLLLRRGLLLTRLLIFLCTLPVRSISLWWYMLRKVLADNPVWKRPAYVGKVFPAVDLGPMEASSYGITK